MDTAEPSVALLNRAAPEATEPDLGGDPEGPPIETDLAGDPDDPPIAREALAATRIASGGLTPLDRPAATRLIAVANQKGGVGKTTTAVNVAVALALRAQRVLVVDLDPQGNASTGLGVPRRSDGASMYDVLIREVPLDEAITPVPQVPGAWCARASIALAGAEVELVPMVARERRLRRALERSGVAERFDYVLLDCPPSLGLLTVNALTAASELLVPIQCEYYALEGVTQLMDTVALVRGQLNSELELTAVVLTMYDGRTRLADEVAADVREHFGPRVLPTAVPRSVRLAEAPGFGQSVLTYDPGSRGALAYLQIAKELNGQRLPAPAGRGAA